MKKLRSKLVVLLFVVGLLAACSEGDNGDGDASGGGGDGDYTLRISHLIATDNAAHIAAELFKEEVEKNSDGQIKVEIYPNGELYGSDRETIEAIQLGNIEMTIGGTTTLGNFDQNFYILDLPFLFKDKFIAREALSGELGEKLTENLDEINLKSLGFGYDGIRHITNNIKPIEELADLKGIKLRVQESEIQQDIFNALGTNPSPLAYGEVYTALQQNTFDGIDMPATLILESKFYEVQDYLTLTAHSYSGAIILLSNEFFEQLPEDLQQVVVDAGKKMEDEYYRLQDQDEDNALEELKAGLIEVNEISDDKREEFVEAVQPVYEKYKGTIDVELFDIVDKYNQ